MNIPELIEQFRSEDKCREYLKQLQRTLGVGYKTAWYLRHRVRSAMEEDSPVPLDGIVEVDETWIGGKRKGSDGRCFADSWW